MQVSAIIVAAGSGQRLGGSVPKQFQSICGKPLIYYTLQKFEDCAPIDEVILVAAADWLSYVSRDIIDRFDFKKVRKVVAGGSRRQDSVFAGIKALDGIPDIVTVHDAVRPFVSTNKIAEAISACVQHGGAILAVLPKDTIKIEKAGFVDKTPSRDIMWLVQTPQVFKYDILYKAYQKAYECGVFLTDDAALVERLGVPIKIVFGEYQNIKITVPFDLKLAEYVIEREK